MKWEIITYTDDYAYNQGFKDGAKQNSKKTRGISLGLTGMVGAIAGGIAGFNICSGGFLGLSGAAAGAVGVVGGVVGGAVAGGVASFVCGVAYGAFALATLGAGGVATAISKSPVPIAVAGVAQIPALIARCIAPFVLLFNFGGEVADNVKDWVVNDNARRASLESTVLPDQVVNQSIDYETQEEVLKIKNSQGETLELVIPNTRSLINNNQHTGKQAVATAPLVGKTTNIK